MSDKKVLTIQDISCVGQCSLTVALPIISACGIETCILPSAVLSTHTGGFKGFTFRDLADDMPAIMNHWLKKGISFDAIYTGYLGSKKQIEYVGEIMDKLLAKDGLRIVDPAMADNGKLYPGFDTEFAKAMGTLCGKADMILPNITEASLITGMDFKQTGDYDESYILSLCARLAALGAKTVILTGVGYDDDKLGVAVYDSYSGKIKYYFHQKISKSSHGTGDVYSSAFTGAVMRGLSVYDAAKLAADFTVECLLKTIGDESHWYGVKFEKALPMLVNKLNRETEE